MKSILLFLFSVSIILIKAQPPIIKYTVYSSNYCTDVPINQININSTGGVVQPMVTTFAGKVSGGYQDGQDTNAKFNYPSGICIDKYDNLYIADQGNNRIRKITPGGMVTTFAGSTLGFKDSTGTNAKFYGPAALVADTNGDIYVSDYYNHKIRKITPSGVVTTFAGSTIGFVNDTGTKAKFNGPSGIIFDSLRNFIVVEQGNNRIRRITPNGVVSFIAGNIQGITDGTGAAARFSDPFGICMSKFENAYFVADLTNQRIRKVSDIGKVTTVAGTFQGFLDATGTSAQFFLPTAIINDRLGNFYIADLYNHRIRRMTTNYLVTTIAGNGITGLRDTLGEACKFNGPSGLALASDGTMFIVDQLNHVIRKLVIYTISPPLPAGLTLDATTGSIFGTPTAVTPPTTYVVTGSNLFGFDTARITFSTGTFAPSVNAAQVFCNHATVADLVPNGPTIKWYDTLTGGIALSPADTLISGKTYYATQVLNACESKFRTPSLITINRPATPTGLDSQVFCIQAKISDLVAAGSSIIWYDSLNGGKVMQKDSAIINGRTYYATQTVSGCESKGRLAVKVTILFTPAPTGPANQQFCGNAIFANLNATGTAVKWYDTIVGGTAYSLLSNLTNSKKYYATQTIAGCESTNRLPVNVTLVFVGPPTGSATQEFCNVGKISELKAVGNNINWYANATGGSPLNLTNNIVSGTTYYAEQEVNGCFSNGRLAVTATILVVTAPTAKDTQQFCNNAYVSQLDATGTNIEWFANPIGGSALSPNMNVFSAVTYYAAQTVNGCVSDSRKPVLVILSKTPAPAGKAQQVFCNKALLTDLVVYGSNINWYDTITGGLPLSWSTNLVDGKIYYASMNPLGCESALRLAVTAVVVQPDTFIKYLFNGLTVTRNGTNYQWFICDTGYTPILGANEKTYYPKVSGSYALEVTHLGCTSRSSCYKFNKVYNSIEDLVEGAFTIYPNPTEQKFSILLSTFIKEGIVEIYNMEGKRIMLQNFEQTNKINIELKAPSGIYMVKIRDEKGHELGQSKLIIR